MHLQKFTVISLDRRAKKKKHCHRFYLIEKNTMYNVVSHNKTTCFQKSNKCILYPVFFSFRTCMCSTFLKVHLSNFHAFFLLDFPIRDQLFYIQLFFLLITSLTTMSQLPWVSRKIISSSLDYLLKNIFLDYFI